MAGYDPAIAAGLLIDNPAQSIGEVTILRQAGGAPPT
jgi:hypothetical protein